MASFLSPLAAQTNAKLSFSFNDVSFVTALIICYESKAFAFTGYFNNIELNFIIRK